MMPLSGVCPRCGEDWDVGSRDQPPYDNCCCEPDAVEGWDEDYEREAYLARMNDFADTGGRDWT